MNDQILKTSLEQLQFPCYIYNEAELSSNILAFEHAFSSRWNGEVVLGFSVKTAPIAGLIKVAADLGCYIEVVSDEEFNLALQAGTDPKRVIFNGPIKTKDWLYFALQNGAIVNLDSNRELKWTIEFAKNSSIKPKVGLRIGFNLQEVIPGESVADDGVTRFGFDWDNGSFSHAVSCLRAESIEPVGIHAHFSTKKHLARSFESIAAQLCTVVMTCGLRSLRYVDMGGGYYGGGANRSYYDEYAVKITDALKTTINPESTTLILEPGGSILATAAKYAGRVLDIKEKRDIRLIITELSALDTNPMSFGRLRNSCEVISGRDIAYRDRPRVKKQELCGYTCMEMDRLALLVDYPEIKTGDIVVLDNTGAYTTSFSPAFFIKQPPRLYLQKGDSFREMSYYNDSASK